MPWLFLFAYLCSGFAGLVYEVSWTRLLTLFIGHTTAAASAVVAAFLGGLAIGAAVGGRLISRLSPRHSLYTYAALEIVVAFFAILLPFELRALTPLLSWAYSDGTPGLLFPSIRLLACLLLVFAPACALGATFPAAVRWFAQDPSGREQATGLLYAVNTAGAAAGALLAGFTLIPAIGVSGATYVAMAASTVAALCVLSVARSSSGDAPPATAAASAPRGHRQGSRKAAKTPPAVPLQQVSVWLPAMVLGLTGCASLVHEIVWTRILALLMGPTTYAFAAALAAVIGGTALGSAAGAPIAGRTRRPAAWLTGVIAAGAAVTIVTSGLAGSWVPRLVATQMAASDSVLDRLSQQGMLVALALIVPTAFCLGAAFPFGLALATTHDDRHARRAGLVYAINTVGAVAGSLAAGFLLLPLLGLQSTLRIVNLLLVAAAALVALRTAATARTYATTAAASAAAVLALVLSPPWDRELLASGPYLYARYVPKDLDLETLLKAGTLLYYREGASSTVTVKRLTGTTTLAVDGKVDASNRSDMLTQKLVAHLPLLLHDNPQQVAIVGLGSGVTLGAALRHPIAGVDVVEISPEVVEASDFFSEENHRGLDDPRTRLIVGDGRSHLMLGTQQYDVIVSEPSNPWIAGVAALFTKEFFEGVRARLAPGGIVCQWAHTYNISNSDLRSIVATFRSVFPDGTLWLVGGDDILMIAGTEPLTGHLDRLARNWDRASVADDLKEVAAVEPFSLLSLYAGGAAALSEYATGGTILTDDRMTLEFTGPRELHRDDTATNGATLAGLLKEENRPAVVRDALAAATASQWRHRAEMLARSDMHAAAYEDYVSALQKNATDRASLDGLVREAVLARRVPDALSWVRGLTIDQAPNPDVLVALSKLYAANSLGTDALVTAHEAVDLDRSSVAAAEQLASLAADTGDRTTLATAVARLREIAPEGGPALFYSAVAAFLDDRSEEAVALGQQAIVAAPAFAPVHDLVGAAYTKLGKLDEARSAFQKSLTFDRHDSTAYTNLGIVELAAGDRQAAARYFAEALSLAPESQVARRGLAQAQ